MSDQTAPGIEMRVALKPEYRDLLMPESLDFIADLQRKFGPMYESFAGEINARQAVFKSGDQPDFLAQTAEIRESNWTIGPSPIPKPLQDHRVELVASTERSAINAALASGAQVFTARMEHKSPTDWQTVMKGHSNLRDTLLGVIGPDSVADADVHENKSKPTLVFQPRPWPQMEENVYVDGKPVYAPLFDFGLFFFTNQEHFVGEHKGCFLHLPKLYGHQEALVWNEVFMYSQDILSLPRGKIKVIAPIETVSAALEMNEILYELRDHAVALSCGYQDYISDLLQTVGESASEPPHLEQSPPTVHCLRSLSQLLVQTCHRRGAYAIGDLTDSMLVPNDDAANREFIAHVRAAKEQEAEDGFDGSRVGHPDLVPVVREVFDRHMGQARELHDERAKLVPSAHDVFVETRQGPNQLGVMREDVEVGAEDLLALP